MEAAVMHLSGLASGAVTGFVAAVLPLDLAARHR
jgi:hypothetical protein